MAPALTRADVVIGINPFHLSDALLAAAVCRAGGLGVLDLSEGSRRAREALAQLSQHGAEPFGVRVGPYCSMAPQDVRGLPGAEPHTVILAGHEGRRPGELVWAPGWDAADAASRHRLLIEVTSLAEAQWAVGVGAHGLIARGAESGGRVGELGTFVLLQQLLRDPGITVPVWACGGIGLRTAVAAVAGGAAGVVLDTQLALLDECGAPEEAAAAVCGMDGSETVLVAGHRILRRGTPPPSSSADKTGDAACPAPDGLPVGQDGFLADRFARRWRTVGGTVRAIHEAIADAARQLAPAGVAEGRLGPQAPMSRALGTDLPVVQGPMTRVSDQPEFAAAVAQAGGLPCVALAMAGPQATEQLLERTSTAIGDRPWGVGLLGFAPEELRSGQMAAVVKARPSHAIVAGGRPSQARVLEEAGIRTFLHVPSPGLLRQFLDAGVRRFVFEGAECGGHVGPRYSFPLWEAQVAVLEEFLEESRASQPGQAADAGGQVEVLFAGGIHDERSAAMVTALAEPLTARGVAVGFLMGTAYLFTEEAVGCGAVQPLFQSQAVLASRTVLLRTAPGHATRCLPGPFTREFEARREELRSQGVAERQLWEELELLNVGRLRIASKGTERVDGALVPVGEEEQRSRGMFMAGQVAVLRSATTSLAELHEAVSSGAAAFLAARATAVGEMLLPPGQAPTERSPSPLDIAVVGMACMFPQAPDLASFWANIVAGSDAVTEVPAERWDASVYYAPEGGPGTVVSKWGAFVPRIPFDPLRYGIPPNALASIEPVQLLALETAHRALQDAGYAAGDDGRPGRDWPRSRTCVVFGAEAGSDLSHATVLSSLLPGYLADVPDGLTEQLPRLTEDSFPGMLANVISGRIANRLDLAGANFTVDAACASSLAALDVACKELVAGTSDVALCGGADLHNGINDYLLFGSVHALSPSGRSRPFDAEADGIVLGEGIACVVLKRLADAERDGDRVYAVIAGIGSASDGRAQGLTAPRVEGQRAALERAYHSAGVSPADVGLLEAHGTGTVVGDRTELSALVKVFEEADAGPASCTLGSVKSQIGHTKCAAGLAGLIKSAMALHTGTLPPTINLERPNDAFRAEGPFTFRTQASPWAVPPAERIAGVSAFGFGGTNFHAVLRAHEGLPPQQGVQCWPAELFLFRGVDRGAALRKAADLLRLVEDAAGATPRPGHRLRDLALTASRRARHDRGQVQIAVVAPSVPVLAELLRRAIAGEQDPAAGLHVAEEPAGDALAVAAPPGSVAFLFPGQGSQRPGMFREIFTAFPWLQRRLDPGRAFMGAVYPPAALDQATQQRQRDAVTDTRIAQPALGIMGLAGFDLLERAGVRPAMAGGHSYGELVALCAAGAVAGADLVPLSEARARAVLESVGDDPGAMAAVAAGSEDVERLLAKAGLARSVVVANHNAPRQTVVSGPTEDIETAVRALREAGRGVKRLPVACAFHSPLIAGATERFAPALAGCEVGTPEFPVWSNRTARPYASDPDGIRAELCQQLVAPVRFAEQVEAMYQAGARIFVEAGPGSVLSGLTGAVLADRPHLAVPLQGKAGGLPGFLDTLARLAVAGVPVRTGWMFDGRDAVDAEHMKQSRVPGWTVDGHLVRTATGELPPGALAPARRLQETIMTSTPGTHSAAAGGQGPHSSREALIAEFIRTSREMIAAQRDVLLTHLGAADEAAARPEAPVRKVAGPVPAPRDDRASEPAARPPLGDAAGDAPLQAPKPELTRAALLKAVIDVISERTGYPVDLIEPELDLEADLSIDSIKRTEIAGELASRLVQADDSQTAALSDLPDDELQKLSNARSASAITAWLAEHLLSPADDAPEQSRTAVAPSPEHPTGHDPRRFRLEPVPTEHGICSEQAASAALTGQRFIVVGGDLAGALESRLASHGAQTARVPDIQALQDLHEPVDGVVLMDTLPLTGPAVLPDGVSAYQNVLARHPRWLIATRPAIRPGDPAGDDPASGRTDGLRGLFRSIAREYPDTATRLVELDPAWSQEALLDATVSELLVTDDEPVVLRTSEGRHAFRLKESALGVLAAGGAGPADDGAAEAAALGLDSDSVVLLIGGARGITAQFAATLASTARCHLELMGRTPLPEGPEDPATRPAGDLAALRSVLAGQGVPLADIDGTARRILAQREVAATLQELSRLGSSTRYQAVDVQDAAALQRAVKEIHAEYGRLDGVIYAAGVIEDGLLADKDPRSFRRVYDTKVEGARALLAALSDLPVAPRFTVLFGSIAAALGNRGQADYASANDAMEAMAARWAHRTGCRALTVHWGPWAPSAVHSGMVTPELSHEYARRGIDLIDPQAGVMALLRELAWGEESVRSVVYTASGW